MCYLPSWLLLSSCLPLGFAISAASASFQVPTRLLPPLFISPNKFTCLLVSCTKAILLRDQNALSQINIILQFVLLAGGVIASIVIVSCLFWVGLVDHVGPVKSEGTALNLPGIPIAIGLYGYCYSGHGVFPNIYSSLKKRNQFPAVLFTW